MIRVSRTQEPNTLRQARDVKLARASLDREAGRKPDTTGYGIARAALYKALNQKCVFCERQTGEKQMPVEHFRPKNKARGNLQPSSDSGYWWLTWTWENLLFACPTCNSGYKKDRFPLEHGARRLPELSVNLASEAQTLIDPVRENPLQEIQFVKLGGNWTPQGRHGSTRGQATVELLGLDRELIDHYNDHVDIRVDDYAKRIEAYVEAGDSDAARKEWQRLLGVFFAPKQPYHSLTFWALAARFPEQVRKTHGLVLPEPGSIDVDIGSSDVDHPEWKHLPDRLQLFLRAIGTRSPAWLDRALLAACENVPQSKRQLVALTKRSEGMVASGLGRLVDRGKLVLDGSYYQPAP